MNKIQQIFGLDPEYNKKMEEQARQLHEKALAGKWCCTCEYCIPVDPNLPGFVTAFPECEYGGMAVETCSRYRVAGTTIEKGIFTCYEIKSCKEDVYSGNGLNFLGEKNYIVTTMECYKDILPDLRSGKFSKHMREQFPESSNYFGVMVAIPDWAEATDEFEKPTPLDAEVRQWKLAVILPCRYGPRKRSMTELLFCMLRSGH